MRRARRVLLHPAVAVLLVAAVAWLASGGPSAAAPSAGTATDPALVARGRALFLTGCSSCHGLAGHGVDAGTGNLHGPSLVDAGGAAAYYQLTTGRMPLAGRESLPVRKPPAYAMDDIDALVAYVASLGHGPAVPVVDLHAGDLADGGVLFRADCQACHSATGAGGALSYGRAAPSLSKATATQIGSAVRTGPGQMPVFGTRTLSPHDVDSIARYVTYLHHPDDRGGLALGRLGPIPEGFLIWVFGIGTLLVVCLWIGGLDHGGKGDDA